MAANPTITEIKDRLNIVDVLSTYIQLKKAGTNYKANCPFHSEKSASFIVSPSRQMWHCFGCGEGGDVISFVMKHENMDFPEALQLLADRAGVKLPEYTSGDKDADKKLERLYQANEMAAKFYHEVLKHLPSAKPAREYTIKRNLKASTIEEWLLGCAPSEDRNALENALGKKGFSRQELIDAGLVSMSERGGSYDRFFGRLTFPIWNASGKIVGFTARILDDAAKAAKYVNSPETQIYHKSRVIFGLYQARQAIRKKDEAVIVEGNMDVIACHQAGFTNVIGSSGTAFTAEQFSVIGRFTKNLKFAFDTDAAGMIAAKRALDGALELGMTVSIVKIEGAKDPDELIRKSPTLFSDAIADAPRYMDFFFDVTFHKDFRYDSVADKKTATETLAPMIAKLNDPIEAAHYIKKLATKLDVPERAVADAVGSERVKAAKVKGAVSNYRGASQAQPVRPSSGQKPDDAGTPRTRGLEERIVGYALFAQDGGIYRSGAMQAAEADVFEIPEYAEAFRLIAAKPGPEVPALEELFPDEDIRTLAKMAVFVVESAYEIDGRQAFEKEFAQILKEFKTNSAKKQLQTLISEIAAADRQKDGQKLVELNRRVAELSQVLKDNSL